jgi:hypothetical protein
MKFQLSHDAITHHALAGGGAFLIVGQCLSVFSERLM